MSSNCDLSFSYPALPLTVAVREGVLLALGTRGGSRAVRREKCQISFAHPALALMMMMRRRLLRR
jgi:hypothetical protein